MSVSLCESVRLSHAASLSLSVCPSLQDQAAKDKALQSMATMSSAQIISPTAFQNKMALQGLSRPTYPTAGGVSLWPMTPTPFYHNDRLNRLHTSVVCGLWFASCGIWGFFFFYSRYFTIILWRQQHHICGYQCSSNRWGKKIRNTKACALIWKL